MSESISKEVIPSEEILGLYFQALRFSISPCTPESRNANVSLSSEIRHAYTLAKQIEYDERRKKGHEREEKQAKIDLAEWQAWPDGTIMTRGKEVYLRDRQVRSGAWWLISRVWYDMDEISDGKMGKVDSPSKEILGYVKRDVPRLQR